MKRIGKEGRNLRFLGFVGWFFVVLMAVQCFLVFFDGMSSGFA